MNYYARKKRIKKNKGKRYRKSVSLGQEIVIEKQYKKDEHYWKRSVKARTGGDLNNQLGIFLRVLNFPPAELSGFDFVPSYGLKSVYQVHNVVPIDLAQQVREFVNNIALDLTLPPCDDYHNQPKRNICQDPNNDKIRQAYENRNDDVKNWIWERYHFDFYRACPLTLEALYGSVILELYRYFVDKWGNSVINGIEVKDLKLTDFVIQLLPPEQDMEIHRDKSVENNYCIHRKIAFVYYLTPDDWFHRVDGGDLFCQMEPDLFASFSPTFNSMVIFEMSDNNGPWHQVRSASRNRISIVGFFS